MANAVPGPHGLLLMLSQIRKHSVNVLPVFVQGSCYCLLDAVCHDARLIPCLPCLLDIEHQVYLCACWHSNTQRQVYLCRYGRLAKIPISFNRAMVNFFAAVRLCPRGVKDVHDMLVCVPATFLVVV